MSQALPKPGSRNTLSTSAEGRVELRLTPVATRPGAPAPAAAPKIFMEPADGKVKADGDVDDDDASHRKLAEARASYGMKETPGAPAFSKELRRRTPKANAFARLQSQAKADKKFNNSTNSLYISETPSAPDERELTLCAAKAVAVLLQSDETNKGGNQSRTPPPQRLMVAGSEPRELIFDERVHPLKAGLKKGVPTREEIYSYMRIIYKRTRMQPECIVMSVSYIEKVLREPKIVLSAHTWRRIVLAALVVADKVFEDFAVWNADFLSLFPLSDIQDLNTLEREFLNLINFETTFRASDYAKYYFALKELSDNKEALPSKPLSQEQADRLESGSSKLAAARTAKEPGLSTAAFSDVRVVAGMDLAMSGKVRHKPTAEGDADDDK